MTLRTGGQVLVDQLLVHGTDLAFCIPGESYLAVLDALHDAAHRLRLVTCRHEANAANMAEAYGKLTGKPGICLVTRGPGAGHAWTGVHTAFQDSSPMILFVGQVARDTFEREAFQEISVKDMFRGQCKWAAEVMDAKRLPEFIARAYQTATSGRPGPVVLGLPEDMLLDQVEVRDLAPYQPVQPAPLPADMDRLRDLLAQAERPLVLFGGGGWTERAATDLAAFCAANNLPAAASLRCQDIMNSDDPRYVGDCNLAINPELSAAIRASDLLLVVGARLGESTTQGYTLIEPPLPKQKLIHIHADTNELGRVYQAALYINSGMTAFCAAARRLEPVAGSWTSWTAKARAGYEASLVPGTMPGTLDLAACVLHLQKELPPDTIVTTDAGNFSGWVNRFWRFRKFRTLLAPTSGAMGYGVPAAIAAKLAMPHVTVVNFSGDGGFMMSGNDLATAVQHEANIIVLVVNNGLYGTIRMHQERNYPHRYPATTLNNPDFAAYARSFGAFGETVTETGQFADAFARAKAANRPALLDLRIDPEAIGTRSTLGGIRDAALRSKPTA